MNTIINQLRGADQDNAIENLIEYASWRAEQLSPFSTPTCFKAAQNPDNFNQAYLTYASKGVEESLLVRYFACFMAYNTGLIDATPEQRSQMLGYLLKNVTHLTSKNAELPTCVTLWLNQAIMLLTATSISMEDYISLDALAVASAPPVAQPPHDARECHEITHNVLTEHGSYLIWLKENKGGSLPYRALDGYIHTGDAFIEAGERNYITPWTWNHPVAEQMFNSVHTTSTIEITLCNRLIFMTIMGPHNVSSSLLEYTMEHVRHYLSADIKKELIRIVDKIKEANQK
jgi:hypothetical protein